MSDVLFLPWERRGEADGHRSVLQLAQALALPLQSSCGGKGRCGKCKVIVIEAEKPLPLLSEREREILGPLIHKGYRLACETVPIGGAKLRVPEESQVNYKIILATDTPHPYTSRLRPNVGNYYVEVPPPVIDSVMADRERLLLALQEAYGLTGLTVDTFALKKVPRLLRSSKEGIIATIWNKKEVVDLSARHEGSLLGMAFDIGTTTVVGYLIDLQNGKTLSVRSALNPQIAFGADVISRISFCQEKDDHLEELRLRILECLNGLISEAAMEAGIDSKLISEGTVVGNTVMHHILLGLDPRYLAMAPYPPVLQPGQDFKARDLGLRINSSAYVHLLPLKAGFVGSDTIACILATGLYRSKVPSLLIDLGTNGEIVLGCKDRLIVCSAAAGPAFEGGHIRCGMRAADGAIERIKIHPGRGGVDLKTIGAQRPLGLCGSGIISATAEMVRNGIILERGNFNEEIVSPRLRQGEDGWEFVLVWASENGNDHDIVVTQKDVAEFQLAKSAIYAGATLLTELFGGEQIRRILLAGAFGNYVDPLDARSVDLLPNCNRAEVISVGNAAGYGACLALVDRNRRREGKRLAVKLQYQELAATERFQDFFIEGMRFRSAHDHEDNL